MKDTFKLITKKIFQTNKSLFLNWIIYSMSILSFSMLIVLLPKSIITIILDKNPSAIKEALFIIFSASFMLFLKTFLHNNARMKIHKFRYALLKDLLCLYLETPYHQIVDSEFLTKINGIRHSITNPEIGIGKILTLLYEFLGKLLSIIGLTIILSSLSGGFIFIILLTIILSFIIIECIEKKEQEEWEINKDLTRKHEKVSDIMMDASYSKDIRIFSLQNILFKYTATYAKEINENSELIYKEKIKYRLLYFLTEMVRNSIVFSFIAYKIVNQSIDISYFLTYSLSIIALSSHVEELLNSILKINKENNKLKAFFTLSHEKEKRKAKKKIKDYTIRFENVSFHYPNSNQLILDHISFTIKEGENAALIGKNGAGKTTIVHLLCRLCKPTSGTIYLNDIDINEIDYKKYISMLSVIFQDGICFPYSIKDNITLSENVNQKRYEKAIRKSNFDAIIEKLDAGDETYLFNIIKEGIDLSGGEMQKLLLARALYKDGSIFIFDEPGRKLDPLSEENLYVKYKEITKDKTSIIISHKLSSIQFCDKILLIDEGKVLEEGSHKELLEKKGRYFKLYEKERRQYED